MYDELHQAIPGVAYDQQNTAHRIILDAIDDTQKHQRADYKGVPGMEHTKVHRVQPFGFSGNPPAGSHGVLVNLMGLGSPLLFGTEHPDHRPQNLPSGGARVYDSAGGYVDLDANGKISAVCSDEVIVRAPKIRLEGDVHITGQVTTDKGVTSAGAHVASAHV